MPEKLFPERQRCKTCSKGLKDTVIEGLYCSYKCAHLPTPSTQLDKAPRWCKRQVGSSWGWKTKYRFEQEVPQRLRDDPETNVYRCDYCHFLHVGHSRVQPEARNNLRRTVADPATLGSVIQRTREAKNWDKKVLAKVLKVPAIRITEIESGNPKMDVVVLFKVLQKLGIIVELIER